MLSFQQIYTNVKTAADELNQVLPSDGALTPIKPQILIAHKQKMLNKLTTLFEKHPLADEKADQSELIQDLRTHLETVWQDINDTLLSYTALPLDSLTRLHVDIANTLAARINQTAEKPIGALKLLMPTLTGLTDPIEGYPNLAPYQDENDKWVIPEVDILKVLTTHVQSDKGTYLVPIQHLVRAFPEVKEEKQEAKHEEKHEEKQEEEEVIIDTRNDLLKKNPYGFADDATSYELSKDEITRLQNYSRLTLELTNAEDNLIALTQKDVSLLGYLDRFINALHLNSKAGTGNEENAGFAAYAAIINFNEYYRHALPETERAKIPKELKDAIDKLLELASNPEKNINAVQNLQTCIFLRREEIDEKKRPYEKLLATIGGAQVESLLTKAKEQIEHTRVALQTALDKNKLNGADPLGIKRSLLHLYGVKPTFSSLADLILITSLDTKDIKELLHDNDIQKSFLNTIENMNDLMGLSIELTTEKLTAILELTNDALFKKCVGNQPHNFSAWVFGLTPEKIEPIVRFNMDAIHALNDLSDGALYSEIFKVLSQPQAEVLLKGGLSAKIMQDHTILGELDHDAQAEILKYIANDNSIPIAQRSAFLENYFRFFIRNVVSVSGKMFAEAIKFNPKLFGQAIDESKEDPSVISRRFSLWIQVLPPEECKILIQQNLDVIKKKIDVGAAYVRALEYVDVERLQTAFDSGLRDIIINDPIKLRAFFDSANNLQNAVNKKFMLFCLFINIDTPEDEVKKVFDRTFFSPCLKGEEATEILVRLSKVIRPEILRRGIPSEDFPRYLLLLKPADRLNILANFNETTMDFYFKNADAIKNFFDAEKKATRINCFVTYFFLKQYAHKAKIPFPALQKTENLPGSLDELHALVKAFPDKARMDALLGILPELPDMKFAPWREYVNFFDLFPVADRKHAAKIFQDKFFAFPIAPDTADSFMSFMPPHSEKNIIRTIFALFEDRLLPAQGVEGLIQCHATWRTLYPLLDPANQYKLADYVIRRFEASPDMSFGKHRADRHDLVYIMTSQLAPTKDVLLQTWKDDIMPNKSNDGMLKDASGFIYLCLHLKLDGIDAFTTYSGLSDKVFPSTSGPGLEWSSGELSLFVSNVFEQTGYPSEKEIFLTEFQKQFFSGKIKCESHQKMAILEELCTLRPQAATELMEAFMSAYEQDRRGHALLKGFGRSDYLKELNQTGFQVIKEQEQYPSSHVNKGYIRVGRDNNLVYKSGPFIGGVFHRHEPNHEPINLSPAELKTFDEVSKPVLNEPRYLTRDELKKIAEITHHTAALAAHDNASIGKIIEHSVKKPKSRTAKVLDKLLNQPGGILGVTQSSSAAQASSAASAAAVSLSLTAGMFSSRSRSNAVDTHPSSSSSAAKDAKKEPKR
jgi:hypothetical protein